MDFTGKKILIAEDEDTNFIYLEELLLETGATILHAKDGNEALEISKNEDIDIILMDIKMPGTNGYQAMEDIKKVKPGIKIIAQTAFAMAGDEKKLLDGGFDDYISKPIFHNVLLDLLSKYL